MTRPRSFAAAIQGSTLAAWSRPVTTISSPGAKVAVIDRLKWNVRVVMFGPTMISAGSTPRRSASASWAASTIASDARDVANVPS
jgi:hypothetical protein